MAQVKFCKRNPGFMDSVRLGAVRAIDECQYQVSVYRPDQITNKGVKMHEWDIMWVSCSFELDVGIAAVCRIPLTSR